MLSYWMNKKMSKAWMAAVLVGAMGSNVLPQTVLPVLGQSQVAQRQVSAIEPLTIDGRLDSSSTVLEQDSSYYNTHAFEGFEGQTIQINLVSDKFETYLLLQDPEGNLVSQNDDGKNNTNARLVLTLPSSGTYTIVANSYASDETGTYNVTVQPASAESAAQAELLNEAVALNQQVLQLIQEGRYSEAVPLAERTLELLETALGENHPDVATILNNLAELYRNQGNYAAAESLYQRSLQIRETVLGENHPDVAQILHNLAHSYQEQSNPSAAEPLYLRAIEIRENALGEDHLLTATTLYNLAHSYREQNNPNAAEPLFVRALRIYETELGENHPDVATITNSLADLYSDQGSYSAAEPLYQRALEIRENTLGDNHPLFATSLNNLALVYQNQGNYSAAEPLHQRALEIRENTLGENHLAVATSLHNLASLYLSQGNYDAAEPLFLQALQIRERALGDNHPDVAQTLNGLAGLYWNQMEYSGTAGVRAEAIFLRALQIRERNLGENHPDVATSLNNLASVYISRRNYSAAEPLLLRALEIRENVLSQNHPDVTFSLNNLASLYWLQENYSAAEPLLLRALEIRESILGDTHPNIITSLNNLASLYQSQGDIAQGLAFLQQGVEVEEANLNLNLSIGSEERKQAYLATLSGTTNQTISLHLQDAPNNTEAAQLALTTVLRRKGRILDAVTDSLQRLRENLTPELTTLLDDYTTTQTQLSNLIYRGLGYQDPDVYRNQLNTLQQQAEDMENQLAQASAEFRIETQPVEIADIQALIPADAALVELVRYQPFDADDPRYAAYILHPNGDIQWADLGDAATIDQVAFAFLETTQNPATRSQVRTTGRTLDELVMEPIRPLLGDATHILLSPDSQLNLIPFAALIDEQDRYLIETYTLTHLTTGRDLLRLQNPAPSQQPPVIFANPNYDTADPSGTQLIAATPTRSLSEAEGSNPTRSLSEAEGRRSADIADLRFGPLPGTQQEVDAIAPLLPDTAVILTGAQATENALKQVQAPSILHIATHGFFLEDVEFVPPESTRGTATIDVLSSGQAGPPPTRRVSNENPLLRSGLAFSGFNPRDSAGEDGVLTALEATRLNLRGTRLVVMSACETGVGQVANGEGVYGLRRAFVMAGAESQLMSLWKVDDQGTAELMQRYYELLLDGEGRSEALRQVQLEFLEAPAYQHPYYWASFLFSGEWRPLD